jgi:hypothetical protein
MTKQENFAQHVKERNLVNVLIVLIVDTVLINGAMGDVLEETIMDHLIKKNVHCGIMVIHGQECYKITNITNAVMDPNKEIELLVSIHKKN